MNQKLIVIVVAVGVASGAVAARVISPRINELKLRASQERAYRAAQFEVWMDMFRERICGQPQEVTGPTLGDWTPEQIRSMVDAATKRIEAYQREAINDLH